MIRRLIVSILILICCSQVFAQQNKPAPATYICSFNDTPLSSSVITLTSSKEAKKIIQSILDAVGLKMDVEVAAATIPNAAAIMFKGKRYILYNPRFIAAVNSVANSKWASIAILAHEMGHHLNGHTSQHTGSRPDFELEADAFSGYALRKMGASLEESQLMMKIIASKRASRTHPGRDERLESIASGWQTADKQLGGSVAQTLPSPDQKVTTTETASESAIAGKYIAYNVHFKADPATKYYVTIRNNVVKVKDNQLYLLGKLASTGHRDFPLTLQTKNLDLFISRTGKILTDSGREVGHLSKHG